MTDLLFLIATLILYCSASLSNVGDRYYNNNAVFAESINFQDFAVGSFRHQPYFDLRYLYFHRRSEQAFDLFSSNFVLTWLSNRRRRNRSNRSHGRSRVLLVLPLILVVFAMRRSTSRADQFVLERRYPSRFQRPDVGHLKLGIKSLRHFHFPLDIVTFFVILLVDYDSYAFAWFGELPRFQCRLVEILDFDPADDSSWPNCSFMHTIVTFCCPNCNSENRVYILRKYFHSGTTRVIASWSVKEERCPSYRLKLYSYRQSGGLISVRLKTYRSEYLHIFDIRRHKLVGLVIENLIPDEWDVQYFLRDPALWRSEIERRTSIYIRIIYYDHSRRRTPCYIYGHCLLEVPIDSSGRRPTILTSEEIVTQSTHFRRSQFRGSRNVFGFYVESFLSDRQIVYDMKDRKFHVITGQGDLLTSDRPFQLFKQRFYERSPRRHRQVVLYPAMPRFLNEMEAITISRTDRVWRTRFQPPSLKHLALMTFFTAYHENVRNLDAQTWMDITGVQLDDHFPSLSEPEVIQF